jgi:hypothetical protein
LARRVQPEKGERELYSARYRQSIGPAVGVDDSHDPSTLPNEAVVEGVNVRVHDGILVSRGGQEKATDQLTGCVYGLIEIEDLGISMLLSPETNLDIYSSTFPAASAYVRLTDYLLTPDSIDLSARYRFLYWREKILLASDLGIYEIIIPEGNMDPTRISIRPLIDFSEALGYTFTPYSICLIPAFPDTFFVGSWEGGVASFDGTTVRELAASSTFPAEVVVGSYRGLLYACGDQDLKFYNAGSWTDVTIPSGTPMSGVTNFYPLCMIEYSDYLYVGGGSDNGGVVLRVSGPTVTVDKQFNTNSDGEVTDFVNHQGILYYAAHGTISVTHVVRIIEYVSNTIVYASEADGFVSRMVSNEDKIYVGFGDTGHVGLGNELGTLLVDTGTLFSDFEGAMDILFI